MRDPHNPRAFPSNAIDDGFGGMTLADHYAGQALVGILAAIPAEHQASDKIKPIVDAAWNFSDAMLAERAKRVETAQRWESDFLGWRKTIAETKLLHSKMRGETVGVGPSLVAPFVAPEPFNGEEHGDYLLRVTRELTAWVNERNLAHA